MDVAGGVGVHVARRTKHVAAVGEVDNQIGAAPRLDAVCAMIVNLFIAGTIEVLAEPQTLHPFEESRMIRDHVFKRAMFLARFAHEDAPSFLHDLRLDDSRLVPEVGDAALAPSHTVHCFSIALGAE